MNLSQFNEKWMEFKGELTRQWDKFTDEDLEQIDGFLDRFIVKVQERSGYGEEKRALMKWADVWQQTSAPQAIGEMPRSCVVVRRREVDHCRTKDGMLTVRLPKFERTKSKAIEVTVAW
jgi:uncharacterized protein YjbJ (UPF0337 family)